MKEKICISLAELVGHRLAGVLSSFKQNNFCFLLLFELCFSC